MAEIIHSIHSRYIDILIYVITKETVVKCYLYYTFIVLVCTELATCTCVFHCVYATECIVLACILGVLSSYMPKSH